MKKIAINRCFGGFDLSLEAEEMLWNLKGYKKVYFYSQEFKDDNYKNIFYKKISGLNNSPFMTLCVKKDYGEETQAIDKDDFLWSYNIHKNREDKDLIYVIETLGNKASGSFGKLKIVEIPDDVVYEIDDYDGMETVKEVHRSWY